MKDADLEGLAAFVHGQLVALHRIAIMYNRAQGNHLAVVFHKVALRFSEKAVAHHMALIAKLSKEVK